MHRRTEPAQVAPARPEGDRQRRERAAVGVEDRRGHRQGADRQLLPGVGDPGPADLGQRPPQVSRGDDRVGGVAAQPGGDGLEEQALRPVGQQHLADRGGVQRQPAAAAGAHRHRAAPRELLDVERLGAVEDGEVDVLVGRLVQVVHERQGDLAQRLAARGQRADLPQPQADPVARRPPPAPGRPRPPAPRPAGRSSTPAGRSAPPARSSESSGEAGVNASSRATTLLITDRPRHSVLPPAIATPCAVVPGRGHRPRRPPGRPIVTRRTAASPRPHRHSHSAGNPLRRVGGRAAAVLDSAAARRPVAQECRRSPPGPREGVHSRGRCDGVTQTSGPLVITGLEGLEAHVGQKVGVSDWKTGRAGRDHDVRQADRRRAVDPRRPRAGRGGSRSARPSSTASSPSACPPACSGRCAWSRASG